MNPIEAMRVHKTIEYIKHVSFIDDGFNWDVDDIEGNEFPSVLAHYGILYDCFSQEAISVMRNELSALAEQNEVSEMVRIYGEV